MFFHKKKLFDENIIKNIYKKDRFIRYVQFFIGSLLVALSFNLFILPNQITYGMSGVGVVLNKLVGDKVEIGDTLFTLYKNKMKPLELIIDDYYEIN